MQDLESMFLSMDTAENVQQEWKDVEGYLTVPYSDDNIVYINNKEVGDISANIVIVNESYSQYVQFETPRYEDGVDLITKRIYVHWEQGDGYTGDNVEAVNVKYSAEFIRFGFVVPASALTVDDEIRIMPFATGEHNGNNYVLKTLYGVLYPQMSLNTTAGANKPNEEWFLTFERKMSSYVEQGTQLLNETKQSEEQTRAIKTFMDDSIFAMAIVNEESGELIQTKDAANMALYEMSVFGKSQQFKTTGAQLFDMSGIPDSSGHDYTFDRNTGVYKSVGMVAAYTPNRWVFPVNPNSTLYIKISTLSDHTSVRVSDILQSEIGTSSKKLEINKSGEIVSLETDDFTELTFSVFTSSEVAIEVQGLMCSYDPDVDWEPYTGGKASPNPDYPQEIENVGDSGSVVVKAFGANLLLKDTTAMTFVTGADVNDNSVQLGIRNIGDVFREGAYLSFDSDVDIPFKLTVQFFERVGAHWGAENIITVTKGFNEFVLSGFVPNNSKNIMLLQIRALSSPASDVTANFSNLFLKFGQEPAEYKPYTEQSFTISTPDGLPGIPVDSGGNYTDSDGQQYIADEIRLNANGTGKWVHNVENVVFDGTESWGLSEVDAGKNYHGVFVLAGSGVAEQTKAMCSHYIWRIHGAGYVGNDGYFDTRYKQIRFHRGEMATVEEWKTLLAELYANGEPLTVLYQLKEPYETDLSAEEVEAFLLLRMNKFYNTVFNDANAYQRIKYIADPKTYINNKIAESIKIITEPV